MQYYLFNFNKKAKDILLRNENIRKSLYLYKTVTKSTFNIISQQI